MKIKCGKFFLKDNRISTVFYDSKVDYYKFVQEYSKKGFFQVVLTSTIMLDLLKKYFLERKFEIVNIEFMEADNELNDEITTLLSEINSDRENFLLLFEKLRFLNESTSVEIKKVEVKSYKDGKGCYLYLQVNGVFGIDSINYDAEENYIKNIVEEYFE